MTQYALNDEQRSLRQPHETFAREAMVPAAVSHDDSRWVSRVGVQPICGMGFHRTRPRNACDGNQSDGYGYMNDTTVARCQGESGVVATRADASDVQKMLIAREPGLSWTRL